MELIEEEIDGFVGVGFVEARDEGKDLIKGVDFEGIASYFEFLLHFLSR